MNELEVTVGGPDIVANKYVDPVSYIDNTDVIKNVINRINEIRAKVLDVPNDSQRYGYLMYELDRLRRDLGYSE
ncbi:MAG: hypothetical protein IKS48_00345 [Eubacterium sp.]|nr:hypothetical protein [Eubacterium sp.]